MRFGCLFLLSLASYAFIINGETDFPANTPSSPKRADIPFKADSFKGPDFAGNGSPPNRGPPPEDGFTPLFAATPTSKPNTDQTKKKLLDTVWEVIEQKLGTSLTNLKDSKEEKEPNQMAPIKKAVLILRPKINERWVAREESLITWAISGHMFTKASKILMNCDLYLGEKMIMSVFKDVPFSIGSESWSPPVFLEPSPNYQLRLWSQPSQIGIIDEYSPQFMIVPRSDDAFMFGQDTPKAAIKGLNGTTVTFKGTDLIRFADSSDNQAKSPKAKNEKPKDDTAKGDDAPKSVYTDSNVPTGIYALYPSNATSNRLFSAMSSYYILISFTILATIKLL